MKNIKIKLQIITITLLAIVSILSSPVFAVDTTGAIKCGVNAAAGAGCSATPKTNLDNTILSIVNVLSALVGIAAVIMIIIAGLRYITSGGKQESVSAAKNGLLSAIIGLVIVALAQVIARFVLHNVTK
jgi:cytochrome bd-type quinol oxidase subunit 2